MVEAEPPQNAPHSLHIFCGFMNGSNTKALSFMKMASTRYRATNMIVTDNQWTQYCEVVEATVTKTKKMSSSIQPSCFAIAVEACSCALQGRQTMAQTRSP